MSSMFSLVVVGKVWIALDSAPGMHEPLPSLTLILQTP